MSSKESFSDSEIQIDPLLVPISIYWQCAQTGFKDSLFFWLGKNNLMVDMYEADKIIAVIKLYKAEDTQAFSLAFQALVEEYVRQPVINRIRSGVIVGKVIISKNHPHAEKIRIAYIDIGEGEPPRQIVYGGTRELKPGDIVPVALPGALLEDGKRLRARNWRGVRSEGMLCSWEEWKPFSPEHLTIKGNQVAVLDLKRGSIPLAPGDSLDEVYLNPDGIYQSFTYIPPFE